MFEFLFRAFRYLRLKAAVTHIRFLVWLARGKPNCHPDAVIQIPSRDAYRKIKAHVYLPKAVKTPSPVLINLHGSGFVFRMHGEDDEWCRKVSQETGHTVLDIKYSLAPERPWPAAPNDAEDVVNWVLGQPERFDLTNISLSGFSAGANISLVCSGVSCPKGTFRSVIAFYPPTNLSIDPAEKISSAPDKSGKQIPLAMERLFNAAYIPQGTDPKDPRISPYFATLDRFPDNVMILTAACDNLCMEGEALAARIEEAGGRNIVRRRFEKVNHAWDKRSPPGSLAEAAKIESYDMALQMLRL